MNPYGPLYSNAVDRAVAWVVTVLVIGGVALAIDSRSTQALKRAERLCFAMGFAGSSICIGIAGIFLFGWLFLLKLKLSSPLWFFWEIAYLESVVVIFQVLPYFTAIAVLWCLGGAGRRRFGGRTLTAGLVFLILHGLTAGLYFVLAD